MTKKLYAAPLLPELKIATLTADNGPGTTKGQDTVVCVAFIHLLHLDNGCLSSLDMHIWRRMETER